jgi:hypothetical protein
MGTFKFFALWLAAFVLLESRWLWAAALVIAGRILIVDLSLSSAEIAGLFLAMVVVRVIPRRTQCAIAAAVLTTFVMLSAMEPFQFLPKPRAFGWVPFYSFMLTPREAASTIFLEKSFTYAMLVWLPNHAGLRLSTSTCLAAALVLATRVVQVYLPGRSAEITDALMVLMFAAVIRTMRE